MNLGLPTAIINGIDEFGGRVLAEELVKKDINVIGIGGSGWWNSEVEGVEFRTKIEEVDIKASYMFDFVGDKSFEERALVDGAKLAIVGINKKHEIKISSQIDWRKIWLHGVYGEDMEEVGEVEWLTKLLRLAVSNKNLMIPDKDTEIRLLAVEEAVEVILRATLLSGTTEEVFEVWGKKYSSEDLVKVLIEEAKMTRYKVVETGGVEIDKPTGVSETWDRLRWEPKIEFKEGIKKTMQYFFTLIDEESRRKVKTGKNPSPTHPLTGQGVATERKKENNSKRMEVVVEEDNEELRITNYELKTEKLEEIEEESADVEAMAGKWEVKPILSKKYYEGVNIKNSNNRPVAFEDNEELGIKNYELKSEPEPEIKLEPVKDYSTINKRSKLNVKWRWVGIGGGVAMVMFLAYFWGSMMVWWSQTKSVENKLALKKYSEVSETIENIVKKLNGRISFMENSGLVKLKGGSRLTEGLKVWREGSELALAGVDLIEQGQVLNDAVFGEKEVDWDKEMIKMEENLKIISDRSGLVEARLGGDWSYLPAGIRERLGELKKQTREVKELTDMGESFLKILPELIGTDGKRKEYIILFQNENELRPTGGFIGSYGILSFEGGKMLNLDIKDVYEADGQLKGHVEPPEPIKVHLNEAGYKMRDSNWEPNFPSTATNIKWFLEKETGRSVDGVIGIDLAVAKAMLEATGEVSVPDFAEKVNKENLYEQAEFYSEKNFFPGSTQKETFLGNLGKQLFEEIKTLKPEKQLVLVKNMLDKLEENEIQISVNDEKVENMLTQMGWNGMIYSGKCPSAGSGCFADYVYVVEANLGVNKANYFIYRSVDEMVEITANSLSRVLKINYENIAKNTNWPGGNYKNYLRVYIPESSNIAEVSVSDPKGGKMIYRDKALSVKTAYGKKEVGVLVEVPIMSKRIVELKYVDSVDINKGNNFSYLQYTQRQSGFGDTGWVTLVSFPDDWSIKQVKPEASIVGGKLLFNQKFTKDIKMGVEIEK